MECSFIFKHKKMILTISPSGFDLSLDLKTELISSLSDAVRKYSSTHYIPVSHTVEYGRYIYELSVRKYFDSMHSKNVSLEYCIISRSLK